jgi:LysM repeat protein
MAVDLIKGSVTLSGEGEEIIGEITVSETIRLSDNMSSIRKILFTDENILIRSSESFLGGVAIKGDIFATVIYLGENDKIDSVKAVLPFEYMMDSSLKNGGAVVAKCAVSRSEILPMKQRRVDLNYILSIKGFCSDEIDYTPLSGLEGAEGMNYLRENKKSSLIRTNLADKELEHTFSIGQQRPGKIIYCGASLTEVATNTSASGILLNGIVNQTVLYTTYDEDDAAQYHTYNDSYALNQFIETDYGISFDSFEAMPYVAMNDAQFVQNESGDVDVEITGSVSTNVALIKEVDYPVITDLFSTSYEIALAQEKVSLTRLKELRKEKSAVVASAKAKVGGINKIAIGKSQVVSSLTVDSGTLMVFGELKSQTLVLKSVSGECETVDSKTDFSIEMKADPNAKYFAYTDVDSITYDLNGEDLTVRADLLTTVYTLENSDAEQPVSATVSSFADEDDNYVTVKVRFLGESDSLWTLAKENRVSIGQILLENSLENEEDINPNQPIVIKSFK